MSNLLIKLVYISALNLEPVAKLLQGVRNLHNLEHLRYRLNIRLCRHGLVRFTLCSSPLFVESFPEKKSVHLKEVHNGEVDSYFKLTFRFGMFLFSSSLFIQIHS